MFFRASHRRAPTTTHKPNLTRLKSSEYGKEDEKNPTSFCSKYLHPLVLFRQEPRRPGAEGNVPRTLFQGTQLFLSERFKGDEAMGSDPCHARRLLVSKGCARQRD